MRLSDAFHKESFMRVQVRSKSTELTETIRDWAQRRVLFAIGQFGDAVATVNVRLGDQNGPKGGSDQHCLMEGNLARGGSVVVEATDSDLYAAISRAADKLHRRVRDAINRSKDFSRFG